MKKLLITVTVATLAGAPAAWAQDHEHDKGGHPAAPARPAAGARPAGGAPGGAPGRGPGGAPGAPGGGFRGAPGAAAGGFRGGPQGGAPGAQGGRGGSNGGEGGRGGQGAQGGRGGSNGGNGGGYGQGGRGGGYGGGGYGGRGGGFHGTGNFFYRGRSLGRFHVDPFVYPYGWGYQRWEIGAFLPALFLNNSYFIDDYANYNFGPPPPGCRWVQFGPDALLVNTYNGAVVDAIYGAFWW